MTTSAPLIEHPRIAVVGAGPAGLMAAEVLSQAGRRVDVYDAMPSAGRKLLLAGKGGLNLTHSEPIEAFCARYGPRRADVAPWLHEFGPQALRAWAHGLGVPTFVGSSGRVFPHDLKAAPLLRAWLHRLRSAGVRFHMRYRWLGWHDQAIEQANVQAPGQAHAAAHALRFAAPAGECVVPADVLLLALGGASWARLGSDGAWVPWLVQRGVAVEPLKPSNCGFDVARAGPQGELQPGWTDHFRSRFAGQPLKNVALRFEFDRGGGGGGGGGIGSGADSARFDAPGEFVVTAGGVEGSLVYAASALLREAIAAHGRAVAVIDLLPGRTADFVHAEVARPRGSRSLSTHLKSRLGLDGVKAALLHELLPRDMFADAARLSAAIKALPLTLVAPRPIDEAISSAGGVPFDALDADLMLRALPGVFCAGEMLDWEAPTGGYLLTACFASGVAAGRGVLSQIVKDGRGG
ncbi:MAG: NAD(FAD)-utilizing dehydrogenase [Methylibium sp. NZG]|nr:MAG: NAD(FAD)-utilizing dehydrogenase [Methylibium sp. NZG]